MRAVLAKMLSISTVCLLVPLSLGCTEPPKPAKTAKVMAGTMPAEAEWTGVYFSPLFGHLHLLQDGNLANAKWVRPVKGRWGKLQGNLDGNLLKFDWEEYVDGLVGPNSRKKGRGYFVYSRPEGDNVDDRIDGEIGLGADEVGTEWHAIKQRNVKPDLDSIGGSGAQDVGGGDWDRDNTEPGDVEEPTKPNVEKPEL